MTTPTRATGAATAQRPEDENLGLGANLALKLLEALLRPALLSFDGLDGQGNPISLLDTTT